MLEIFLNNFLQVVPFFIFRSSTSNTDYFIDTAVMFMCETFLFRFNTIFVRCSINEIIHQFNSKVLENRKNQLVLEEFAEQLHKKIKLYKHQIEETVCQPCHTSN